MYFHKDYNSTLPLHNLFAFNFKEIFEKQGEKKKLCLLKYENTFKNMYESKLLKNIVLYLA